MKQSKENEDEDGKKNDTIFFEYYKRRKFFLWRVNIDVNAGLK